MAWPSTEDWRRDRVPCCGAAAGRIGHRPTIPGAAKEVDVGRSATVDIRVVPGKIPSPQATKSASVFRGLCLMDLTSIQMTVVRDDGNEAPVGAGGANDDEAAPIAGSRIVAGQIVKRTTRAIADITSNAK